MKRFACPACGAEAHFGSLACPACGAALAYAPGRADLRPLDDGVTPCRNRAAIGCNWEAGRRGRLCDSCALTETIPDLRVRGNVRRWGCIEEAKRRLLYSLGRLGLPLAAPSGRRLSFRLLADVVRPDGSVRRILTGHLNGRVTLNIAEADDDAREAMRMEMGEPYRTLLGHFRHEAGHFYYDVLVAEGGRGAEFAALFGDPALSYGRALRRHYAQGPAPGWPDAHVSAYATAHPWEDFAETWAHWLHMVDGLETAARFGLAEAIDPYAPQPVEDLVAAWVPLSMAMNAMNRAMGQADFYPFVLAPRVVEKLAFVHGLRGCALSGGRGGQRAAA